MANVKNTGTLESERMLALERFYVIRPFLEDGVSLAQISKERAISLTGGNFRLFHRVCIQIEHILQINKIRIVTKEVVEAARERLVVGQVLE